jgi:hypothetical protein
VHEHPEVVWCDRIDPCRALVRSVPLPDSGRRYGDLLLHDGEARGKRRFRDEDVSVFDELAVLQPSLFGTWEITVRCANADERDEIMKELGAADLPCEDWTESLEMLCKACSLGNPHQHHEHQPSSEAAWQPTRRLAVAAHSEAELQPLRRARLWWRRGVVDVRRAL